MQQFIDNISSSEPNEEQINETNLIASKVTQMITRRRLLKLLAISIGTVAAHIVLPEKASKSGIELGYPSANADEEHRIYLPLIMSHKTVLAYIPNMYGYVSVIDTATNTVIDTINIPESNAGSIAAAVSRDGTRVYVANQDSKTVSVIDTATNTIVATINIIAPPNIRPNPQGLAVTPDGSRVYLATRDPGTVSVIDTASNSILTTISLETSGYGVAMKPDDTYVYVAHPTSRVTVIDTATNTVVTVIQNLASLNGISVTPDGSRVYTRGSVIDTVTNTVVDTISGSYCYGVTITPDGSYVYMTRYYTNTVDVIDTATNTIVDTIIVGEHPSGAAITPDGLYVYVGNHASGDVSVIDTVTNTVVATINVGGIPHSLGQFIGSV